MQHLFEPLGIGRLTVDGRVFKTASAETRASDDGFVTDELLAFYEPIARAGTPLIITGNIYISRDGRQSARMVGADNDDKIAGLRRLTEMVHRNGSRIFAQLNHCGRQVLADAMALDQAVSASDVLEKTLCTKPRALTVDEIERVVDSFALAAERCLKAGFDGVQIHAAHGYLINQFLTPYTNRRRDAYGGSSENRLRLLLEVCRAVRQCVGPDFPVIVKLNGTDALPFRRGLHTQELIEIALALERERIDAVEVSIGHYESGFGFIRGTFRRFFKGLMQEGVGDQLPPVQRFTFRYLWPVASLVCNLLWKPFEGFNARYAQRFCQALGIPVICVGGFHSAQAMEHAIATGVCDAVSCARAMIADPYLYAHLKSGEQGPKCVYCNACIARAGRLPLDCYHPEVRREKDAMLEARPQSAMTR